MPPRPDHDPRLVGDVKGIQPIRVHETPPGHMAGKARRLTFEPVGAKPRAQPVRGDDDLGELLRPGLRHYPQPLCGVRYLHDRRPEAQVGAGLARGLGQQREKSARWKCQYGLP